MKDNYATKDIPIKSYTFLLCSRESSKPYINLLRSNFVIKNSIFFLFHLVDVRKDNGLFEVTDLQLIKEMTSVAQIPFH